MLLLYYDNLRQEAFLELDEVFFLLNDILSAMQMLPCIIMFSKLVVMASVV